jgi:hypothetical protein
MDLHTLEQSFTHVMKCGLVMLLIAKCKLTFAMASWVSSYHRVHHHGPDLAAVFQLRRRHVYQEQPSLPHVLPFPRNLLEVTFKSSLILFTPTSAPLLQSPRSFEHFSIPFL